MGVKLQPSLPATAAAVYALVYQAAAANANDVAFTLLPYDTVVSQSSGNPFDTGAAHAFTCPRAGTLAVTAHEQIASVAYTELVLCVYVNGVERIRGPQVNLTVKAIWLATRIAVVANDVVDVRLFQQSGAARALGTGVLGSTAEFSLT